MKKLVLLTCIGGAAMFLSGVGLGKLPYERAHAGPYVLLAAGLALLFILVVMFAIGNRKKPARKVSSDGLIVLAGKLNGDSVPWRYSVCHVESSSYFRITITNEADGGQHFCEISSLFEQAGDFLPKLWALCLAQQPREKAARKARRRG